LPSAIESALAQDYEPKQVIVVDDGSTDDSANIIRSFGSATTAIFGPNRGVSAARNRGIRESSGDWIVFLDADDILTPGTLRLRSATAAESNADVVICDWQELTETAHQSIGDRIKTFDFHSLNVDAEVACATNWAQIAALMYGRALVDRIGGFRESLPVNQDARFLFDAAYCGAKFVHSPHVGAVYRIQSQGLYRRDRSAFWRDILTNGKQIEELWRSRGSINPAQRAALIEIYNDAAHGLFRELDPTFRTALADLRNSGLPISWRNYLANAMMLSIGHRGAAKLARIWRKANKRRLSLSTKTY
jgi:glycosyltransferase involved in cell wall biosynthesis